MGQNGASSPATVQGGGGGGGGFNGNGAGSAVLNNVSVLNGGNGGRGGNGGNNSQGNGSGGGGGGAGGFGALVSGSLTSSNTSTVGGGAGGDGGNSGTILVDGPQVQGAGGRGGDGGDGVLFSGSSSFSNSGSVNGGRGGNGGNTGGNSLAVDPALRAPAGDGGNGGAGVSFLGASSVFDNAGIIQGGAGGGGGPGRSPSGGTQSFAGAAGGRGGTGGAGAAFFGTGAAVSNTSAIAGGNGGQGGPGAGPPFVFGTIQGGAGGTGGRGGDGISFAGSDATLANQTTISGGSGGAGGSGGSVTATTAGTAGAGGDGASGGAGAIFAASRATLVNRGAISGGNGGAAGAGGTSTVNGVAGPSGANGMSGAGGIGVVANGITIDNTGGTISGGYANGGAGPQAFAIQFNGGTNHVGGSGQINGGIYVAGGSFQPAVPGSAVGSPLAVNGPIAFAPGTFYTVRVTPTANDRVDATGTATLTGATVNVLAGAGTYRTGRRTILNANGGLGGTTFSGVTTNLAFLQPVLSYDNNNVFLNISGNAGGNRIDYRTAASTDNQFAVAGGLTAASRQAQGRDGRRVLAALNQLTVPQAQRAFDSLSGEGIAAAQNVAFRSTQLFTSAIFDQTTFYAGGGAANSVTLTAPTFNQPIRELADLPARPFQPVAPVAPTRTWRAWATGFGGVENISGNGRIGSASQRNDIYGGALGVDYQLTPNYLVGVAVGGSNGNFRVDQRGTTGSTTGGHIAIYDLYELGAWYGASSSSFSYFGNQTTRFTSGFGGLGTEQNRGNFNSNEFRSRIEIGRHFASLPAFAGLPSIAGFGTVTPFLAIELASLRSNGFTETPLKGGPGLFRLNVSGQSASSAPGFVGLRFQRVTPFGNGMVLSPTLQVAYVHEFAPYRNQIGTLASLPGSTFLVDGARPARDAAQVKAGAELGLGPNSAIFANFDGEFSGINQLYAGKGGFRYVW